MKTGSVLVHCAAGQSRSVAIVVAFLIWHLGMSFDDAMKHVKSRRLCACPNIGFVKALHAFAQNRDNV